MNKYEVEKLEDTIYEIEVSVESILRKNGIISYNYGDYTGCEVGRAVKEIINEAIKE